MSCFFESGWVKKENNNSWNNKDFVGFLFHLLIITAIILTIFYGWKVGLGFGLVIGLWLFIQPIIVLYAFNACLVPFTRTPPYLLNRAQIFPLSKILEHPDTFIKIKQEVLNVVKQQQDLPAVNQIYGDQNETIKAEKDGWRVMMIKAGNTIVNEQYCPFLTSLIKGNSNIISCMLSILQPRRHIPIHVGYSKSLLRYQLAVIVPKDRDNCFICVNGEKYSWIEGEGVMFDDCYPHKVYNNTDDVRVIVYMDILRPYENSFLNLLNEKLTLFSANSDYVKEETQKTEVQLKI